MKKTRESLLAADVSEEVRERIFKSADFLLEEMGSGKRPAIFTIAADVSEGAKNRIFSEANATLDATGREKLSRLTEASVDEEVRQRVFKASEQTIEKLHEEKTGGLLARLFGSWNGLFLAGAGAAVALLVVLNLPQKPAKKTELALEPELFRNVDILLDLETLENWNPAETENGSHS